MIDPTYLPFDPEMLRAHFTPDANVEGNLRYYLRSAAEYEGFRLATPARTGLPLSKLKAPCQIEKDERFWTAACWLALFHGPHRTERLQGLLSQAFGRTPPLVDLTSWPECLEGDLQLYLEASLPSPTTYTAWLREALPKRHLVPYVFDAAAGSGAGALEGATHVDALLINVTNGFAVLVEAKVLSDISTQVQFDAKRNQLIRSIDVMLEQNLALGPPRSARIPERSLFVLLTPEMFRREPHTRLYGWMLREYQSNPTAMERDLPHRKGMNWGRLAQRLGWLTWEECAAVAPGVCGWLAPSR